MESTREARSSVLSQYFSEIRDYPLLTREEEQELAREIRRGNQEARDELVKCNLSFVAKVASEYRSLGIPFEDLLNEGNLGLIEAAQRFDPEKDNKFISYAIWWIRKAILKALSEKTHVVRMPYSQIKKFKEIRRAEKELQRTLGRKPDREEISVHLSRSVNKVDRVLQYGVHELSLDVRVGEDQETPLSDVLVDEGGNSPEDKILEQEINDGVGEVYCRLNEQQKTVLAYRYGVLGERSLTLQETGDLMGVSRERVRQIENQAKERMRKMFHRKRRVNAYRNPAHTGHVRRPNPEPAR
jgi:RNA polymerase primary sigma factor